MPIANHCVVMKMKEYTFSLNFVLPFQLQGQYNFKICTSQYRQPREKHFLIDLFNPMRQ